MSEKKVKLRMGMHNRVTKDRWQAIKDDCRAGLPTAKIAKRHSVSESTVRKVKRSEDFRGYQLNNDKRLRKPIAAIEPSTGVPYEDFGPKLIFFSPKKVKPSNMRLSNRLDREAENTAKCLGMVIVCIVGLIALALVIVFISSFAGGSQ